MVYTGPHTTNDFSTIKLAIGNDHTDWKINKILLSGSNSGDLDLNKETSFYRLADSGKHQIYYIGYEDENTYMSQIFMAEADSLEGPYSLPTEPIIRTMVQDGLDVKTMTLPSIVEHLGKLYMVYCAWDAFPDPSIVRVHGATSDDDGQTWDIIGEVEVPSCMEGSFTKGPDGLFYSIAQTEERFFSLGVSDVPFPDDGYQVLSTPIMSSAGAPWEIDEMNTPQLFFDNEKAFIYYSGKDFTKGWWIMLAETNLITRNFI